MKKGSGRLYLKKEKNRISPFIFVLCTFFTALLASFFLLFFVGKKLEPIIINYATIETKRIANAILNDVIRKENFLKDLDADIYQITRNNENEIELIDFNTSLTNDLLTKINEKATKRLMDLERGNGNDLALSNSLKGVGLTYLDNGIVCEIPLGVLVKNALIVNSTTVIPIRFSFIGTVSSNLKTKVTSYGINNALLEISVEVTISEQVTMPHTAENVKVTSSIPLVVELVQGKVPSYYQDPIISNSEETSSVIPSNS